MSLYYAWALLPEVTYTNHYGYAGPHWMHEQRVCVAEPFAFYFGAHVNRLELLHSKDRQRKWSLHSILTSYQQHYFSFNVYNYRICHRNEKKYLFLTQHFLFLFQNKSPLAFFFFLWTEFLHLLAQGFYSEIFAGQCCRKCSDLHGSMN